MVRFLQIVCAYFLPAVLWAIDLEQKPISITKQPGAGHTAEFTCTMSGGLSSTYIHWYRAQAGRAPQRLLYHSSSKPEPIRESSFSSEKLTAYFQSSSMSKLLVYKLEAADSGHYYCAAWDRTVKIFGTGTKLVINSKEAKFDPKKIQTLFLTEQDGKGTHMCLIEDFFPNVIKVTWKSSNEEKNAIRGEIWSPDDKQNSYSVSSWLTVDDPNKTYNLTYEHESGRDSILLQSQGTSRAIEGCINMLPADLKNSFTHTTAYLIYIILLLKSTMYYVIVLFFIYRMKDPNKHQGKKP